jgi:hypothetical protein
MTTKPLKRIPTFSLVAVTVRARSYRPPSGICDGSAHHGPTLIEVVTDPELI